MPMADRRSDPGGLCLLRSAGRHAPRLLSGPLSPRLSVAERPGEVKMKMGRSAEAPWMDWNSVFQQVRVVDIPEIEVDTGETSNDFIFRLLLVSRTGDQIALELTFEHFHEVLAAA